LTTLKLGRVIAEIYPEGVFNVVVGRGQSVGDQLINHPGIEMLSLTGSIGTGQKVLEAASKSIKRTHLELGGKAPVIVFDDADLESVVSGLKAFSFYNAGQDCTAASRVYAGKGIYEKLVADLASAASSIRFNQSDDAQNEMGPLISATHRDRVSGFVDRAAGAGHIEVLTGGKASEGNGFFYEPTIVAGARQEDEIVRREVFGPVVSVTPFDDVDGLDPGRRPRDGDGGAAALRLHLDQLPLHAGQRDAAWRCQEVRLWQGSLNVCLGGLHRGAACDGQARLRLSLRRSS
jgi:aminobutyraldehyde dehydrogenase